MNTVTLKEVLQYLDTPMSFSIAFVTADHHKKKGGEWIAVEQAWKHEPLTKKERARLKQAQPDSGTTVRKHPRHYENSTRNLRFKNGNIRKVHIRLITMFNGKIVL